MLTGVTFSAVSPTIRPRTCSRGRRLTACSNPGQRDWQHHAGHRAAPMNDPTEPVTARNVKKFGSDLVYHSAADAIRTRAAAAAAARFAAASTRTCRSMRWPRVPAGRRSISIARSRAWWARRRSSTRCVCASRARRRGCSPATTPSWTSRSRQDSRAMRCSRARFAAISAGRRRPIARPRLPVRHRQCANAPSC